MAAYEVVREIQNECSRNTMRDVSFYEIDTDDPVGTVQALLKNERNFEIRAETVGEGNMTIFANCSGTIQKFLFTRI